MKGTPELIADRRETIVNACEKLYGTMSFKEITLKEIGNEVPFSRPTIYNYFRTKEEIFLALFEREYDRWRADLERVIDAHETLTGEEIAEAVARTLEKRTQLLKLLSMNNYDMEANSRQELLTDFKVAYGNAMQTVRALLRKFRPGMDEAEIERFLYVFFPFMFGIYPYTAVTEKQREAMLAAGVAFTEHTVYALTRACVARLLEDGKKGESA